jgi:hypothetical protein
VGFIIKTIGIALLVLGALYGVWWIFIKYSILTIFSFVFIVVSLFVISGLGIALMNKVKE